MAALSNGAAYLKKNCDIERKTYESPIPHFLLSPEIHQSRRVRRVFCSCEIRNSAVDFTFDLKRDKNDQTDASTLGVDGKSVTKTLQALKSRNRAPKRWLGQHYMVNDDISKKTVEAAQISPGDIVLEIGPGTGALTQHLITAGAFVVAVEKDADMVSVCMERFQDNASVSIIHSDFIRWPIEDTLLPLLEARSKGRATRVRAKVVSNLPFNITTEVLQRLLPMGDAISQITLMLQDEAAIRIMDPVPRPNDYRQMNVFVSFFSRPLYHFFVDRTNFLPPPKVHAAVVSFKVKTMAEYPPVESSKAFFAMVNRAFNGKRKMLRNSLQPTFSSQQVMDALALIGLPPTSRPEELTMDQFLSLFSKLSTPQRLPFSVRQLDEANSG